MLMTCFVWQLSFYVGGARSYELNKIGKTGLNCPRLKAGQGQQGLKLDFMKRGPIFDVSN